MEEKAPGAAIGWGCLQKSAADGALPSAAFGSGFECGLSPIGWSDSYTNFIHPEKVLISHFLSHIFPI